MPFKVCSKCNAVWNDLSDFVADSTLELNGYQAAFDFPDDGYLLFTHMKYDCCTTLAIKVNDLKPLSKQSSESVAYIDRTSCPQYCARVQDFRPCHEQCAMTWIREIMQQFTRPELTNKTRFY